MRMGWLLIGAAAIGVVALAGLGTQASESKACDRQLVMRVDSAKVSVEPDGFQIDVFGLSESAGWSNATLIVTGSDNAGTVHADFVACRPEVSAQVLTPIQTRTMLDLGLDTRTIIIRAKTNSMTIELSAR